MYVTARNFIYDVSLVLRKYFIVHFNDILYHQVILWGQKFPHLGTTQVILYQELCLARTFYLKHRYQASSL